jgi:hypothetical protein
MKTAKWVMIFCILLILSACAAVDTNSVKYQTFNPGYAWMQDPPVGKPVAAKVGQPLAVEALAAVFDGFISRGTYEIHIADDVTLFPKHIAPDDEFIIWGELPSGDVVVRNMAFARAVRSDLEKGKLELVLIARKSGEVHGYASFAHAELMIGKMTPPIKLHPQRVSVPVDFRQDLIYRGKSGDILRLDCLEYMGDMATPASKKELIYNLAASKAIAANGVFMDVIEATEEAATVVVKRYLIGP